MTWRVDKRKMTNNSGLSVIIPTRDRPDDLVDCLSALKNQTTLPEEVIVVNDGSTSVDIQQYVPEQVSVQLTESKGEAGTSTARNTGVQLASHPIVLILDDDAILGPNYLARLQELYSEYEHDDLAGIGGFDASLRNPGKLEKLFNKIFLLGGQGWSVNDRGFQSWDSTISSPCKSDWLSGNNASFKREVLLEHPFPHWSGGREALEDIAMGWQLKNHGYHCIIDPQLSIDHRESQDNETAYNFGVKRARNRVRMYYVYSSSTSIFLFIWSMFGNILKEFLAPISEGMWLRYWTTAVGMIVGATTQILLNSRDIDEIGD